MAGSGKDVGMIGISRFVLESKENNLCNLAAALEAAASRVCDLREVVKMSSAEVQERIDKETADLHAILSCLSVVADDAASKLAEWRASLPEDHV